MSVLADMVVVTNINRDIQSLSNLVVHFLLRLDIFVYYISTHGKQIR